MPAWWSRKSSKNKQERDGNDNDEEDGEEQSRSGVLQFNFMKSPINAIRNGDSKKNKVRRYIADPSHVVKLDDVRVKDNLTVESLTMQIEDREVKQLQGKEIALVKVVWGGPAGGNVTWELERKMKDSYPDLFA
ncbi:uncharacterized protein LOC131640290 [Vicia villosa]|uniref:uncharacterized protein LOC131640290 n=1 Tax=Vicia villosa TaxID=3911 RepID=UPI00273C10C3|nr:uncharacterized protein LOC131640290 [Vicia villosa]